MRDFLLLIDLVLRRVQGIFEFWDHPDCLLRVRLTQTDEAISLPDCEVPPGALILELHLWNEHIPSFGAAGPDLAWAVQVRRKLLLSFRALARRLQEDPQWSKVQAIRGITVLFFPGEGTGAEAFFKRLGFTARLRRNPFGKWGELWENGYTWVLIKVFNPASLRHRMFCQLRRTEIWISTQEFFRRFSTR